MEETKSIIKSIIMTYPNGIDLYKLNNLYFEMEGENIPYEKHKYRNLRDFIRSLNGQILTMHFANGYLSIRPIYSEKSHHVVKMIVEEKSNKSRGGGGFGGASGSGNFHRNHRIHHQIHRLSNSSSSSYTSTFLQNNTNNNNNRNDDLQRKRRTITISTTNCNVKTLEQSTINHKNKINNVVLQPLSSSSLVVEPVRIVSIRPPQAPPPPPPSSSSSSSTSCRSKSSSKIKIDVLKNKQNDISNQNVQSSLSSCQQQPQPQQQPQSQQPQQPQQQQLHHQALPQNMMMPPSIFQQQNPYPYLNNTMQNQQNPIYDNAFHQFYLYCQQQQQQQRQYQQHQQQQQQQQQQYFFQQYLQHMQQQQQQQQQYRNNPFIGSSFNPTFNQFLAFGQPNSYSMMMPRSSNGYGQPPQPQQSLQRMPPPLILQSQQQQQQQQQPRPRSLLQLPQIRPPPGFPIIPKNIQKQVPVISSTSITISKSNESNQNSENILNNNNNNNNDEHDVIDNENYDDDDDNCNNSETNDIISSDIIEPFKQNNNNPFLLPSYLNEQNEQNDTTTTVRITDNNEQEPHNEHEHEHDDPPIIVPEYSFNSNHHTNNLTLKDEIMAAITEIDLQSLETSIREEEQQKQKHQIPNQCNSQSHGGPNGVGDNNNINNSNNRTNRGYDDYNIDDSSDDDDDDDEAIPVLDDDDPIFQLNFPDDCMRFNDKIKESQLCDNKFYINKIFPLFVAEVNSPYKFWFHLADESSTQLDKLMLDIELHYRYLDDKELLLDKDHIRYGLYCIGLYGSEWHRAKILSLPEEKRNNYHQMNASPSSPALPTSPISPTSPSTTKFNEFSTSTATTVIQSYHNNSNIKTNIYVKLLFIDYGTVATVPLTNIKYMRKEFAELPIQIYRGCLDNIRPIGHRFSRDSTYCFLSHVSDLQLYGKITDINVKNRIIYMLLTDTNAETGDIQINDTIIQNGYAHFMPIDVLPGDLTKRHFSEKHPTFDELENGIYPSFEEVGHLLKKGIDFDKMQNENPLTDIDRTTRLMQSITFKQSNSNLKSKKINEKSNQVKPGSGSSVRSSSSSSSSSSSLPSPLSPPPPPPSTIQQQQQSSSMTMNNNNNNITDNIYADKKTTPSLHNYYERLFESTRNDYNISLNEIKPTNPFYNLIKNQRLEEQRGETLELEENNNNNNNDDDNEQEFCRYDNLSPNQIHHQSSSSSSSSVNNLNVLSNKNLMASTTQTPAAAPSPQPEPTSLSAIVRASMSKVPTSPIVQQSIHRPTVMTPRPLHHTIPTVGFENYINNFNKQIINEKILFP